MKYRLMLLLFVMVFFFVGCAASLIGQKVPVNKLTMLSPHDRTFTFEGSNDVVIFRQEDDRLVGKLSFGKLGYVGNQIERLTLVAWFTDSSGVILAKSSYSWKSREFNMDVDLDFIINMPEGYSKFVYVAFSYHGTYTG